MVLKPFRFRRLSRWTPRRSNVRGNKKPGISGFFIACDLLVLLISRLGFGSLGRPQAPNLFRIRQ